MSPAWLFTERAYIIYFFSMEDNRSVVFVSEHFAE